MRRRFPLHVHLVNRRYQEDFGERKAVDRILRDLEHGSRRSDSRLGYCTLRAKEGGPKWLVLLRGTGTSHTCHVPGGSQCLNTGSLQKSRMRSWRC